MPLIKRLGSFDNGGRGLIATTDPSVDVDCGTNRRLVRNVFDKPAQANAIAENRIRDFIVCPNQ